MGAFIKRAGLGLDHVTGLWMEGGFSLRYARYASG